MRKAIAVPVFDYKAFVQSLYDKAVDEFWQWRRSGGGFHSCPAALHFKRSTVGTPGDVILTAGDVDSPDGFERAMPLSLAWSDEQSKAAIWRALQTMPILPI